MSALDKLPPPWDEGGHSRGITFTVTAASSRVSRCPKPMRACRQVDSTAPGPQPCARSGGQSRVLVDQPVHPCAADHWTADNRGVRRGRPRRPQLQAAMGPESVVVLHVMGQDRLQVPSIYDQQPVQALAAGAGDPALAPSVRVWGPHRCSDDLQTLRSEDGIEGSREVAVAIMDQEAGLDLRLLQLPGQVPRLLGSPAMARVLAAGGEDDAPAGQL